MIEKLFTCSEGSEKTIEKVVLDDNVNINHMILPEGESLPEHYSNSNVYMIVAKGKVSLELDSQKRHDYPAGSILNIPYNTKMNVKNNQSSLLELFVVKSPAPNKYQE